MLSNIEELAKKYTPIESTSITKTTCESLFKISRCYMSLDDIATFLDFIIGGNRDTSAKINGRFLCVVQEFWGYIGRDKIPRNLTFIKDDRGIELEFCKIRKCSRERVEYICDSFSYEFEEIIDIPYDEK